MPPFEVIADETRGVVVATLTGSIEGKDLAAVIAQARKLSSERGWNILYDMRAATPGGMGAGDLFWLPRRVPELRESAAARVRVAGLHPSQFREFAQFWETTFSNAGLQARAFTDEAEALGWLREDREQAPGALAGG